MPPRRSTRAAAAPSQSGGNRRLRANDDDGDEDEEVQHEGAGGGDDDDDEDAAPVRRGSRRQTQPRTSSQVVATSSQRRVASTSKGRRSTNDDDDDEDDEDEDDDDDDDDDDEDDEDGDVTVTGSRKKGRKSIGSTRDADEDSDGQGNVAAKWRMLERARSDEITKQVRKAAKELGKEEVLKKAADLCRLSLYHEYSKGPLRRPAILQHIFNNDTKAARAFLMVLRYCNKTLRGTFAMELVELKSGSGSFILRNVLPAAAIAGLVKPSKELAEVVAEVVAASASGPSKSRKRSRNSAVDSASQAAENAAANARKNFVGGRVYDSLAPPLDWKAADGQLASMGLLYVVLALILTNGRTLPNTQLRSHLRRLCLPPGEPLPVALRVDGNLDPQASFPARSNLITSAPRSSAQEANNATIDSFLANAVKMHYLEHAKSSMLAAAGGGGTQGTEGGGGGGGASGRRRGPASARASGAGAGDDGAAEAEAAFDWKWGPRATIEVSEQSIGTFISEIWGLGASQDDEEEEENAVGLAILAEEDEEDDDGEEGGGRRRRPPAKKKVSATQKSAEQLKDRQARILRDIERAAGSQLTQ
ncbi:unnamed protein product [Tilletia controversa]|nr:unnamed protein product [Tilletia controversa]